MTTPRDSLMTILGQFCAEDDIVRNQAFSKLVELSRPFLRSLLSQSLASPSDRDDVIQEIFHRMWRSRGRLDFVSQGAYWRFLRTLARNCAIDQLRMSSPTLNLDDPELQDIQPAEHDQVDLLVEAIEDRRRLYRLADDVFLRLPSETSDRVRTRRLLAAKLFLVDKEPWETVCRIVNSGANEEELLGRTDLDHLLTDPAVLLHLAFTELHWENDRLSSYLVEKIGADDAPLTHEHVVAVQLRFQYAMLLDQISSRMDSQIKKDELSAVFDRCIGQFPFVEIMNRLLADVGQFTDGKALFSAPGLWDRLVFQYFSHNSLPQRDIYDRTAPSASLVGHEITMGSLNVRLSNGRLFKKMAEHLAARRGSWKK